MKEWFQSKTMRVSLATGIVGVLIATLKSAPLDPQIAGVVLAGLGALNVFLRSITDTAIGKNG